MNSSAGQRAGDRSSVPERQPAASSRLTQHDTLLIGPDGKEISRTGISIPRFGKGETFELEVIDDDLSRASRFVIQPLGK